MGKQCSSAVSKANI